MLQQNGAGGDRPKKADFVIVGNGALGMFLADELIGRKAGTVVVVGPSSREAGASQAAGAMLGTFSEVTTDTLRTSPSRTRFEIGVRAHGKWPDVLNRLDEVSPTGFPLQVAKETHVVLNTVGAELDDVNLASMISALDEYGRPWEYVDPKDIPGYAPRTDTRAVKAIHLPTEGAIDARGVLAALEVRVRAAGMTIADQTARKVIRSGDVVTGVELDDGHIIEAGNVVIALGARSEAMVKSIFAGDEFELMPTIPGLGFAMIARRTGGEGFRSVVRTPNRGFACGLHVVPAPNGREYFGATNRLVDDVASVAWLSDVRYLAQYSMQQLDEQVARHEIERWCMGNRPVTLDGFPLIGWLPLSGLYLATGTYRDGFHCAPLIAEHVANELQGQPGIVDPMFTPTREPIATRTIESSIDEYVKHNMAAWFETGAEAAPQMTTAQIADYYRVMGVQAYDQLGIDYALGPDVLWFVHGSLSGARRISRYLRGGQRRTAERAQSVGIGEK